MIIDALQYVRPSAEVFAQMRQANVSAVHITVGYHEVYEEVLANLAHWQDLIAENSQLVCTAKTARDIDSAVAAGKTAIFFGLQNPLAFSANIARVEELHQKGISFCQVTYNQQSLLGAGCFEENDSGLTAFGREIVTEMNRVGMVIDLSHAGHKTAMDVVAFSDRPVTVTHANPDAWHPAPRNLHHDLLQALADTGGMVGYSLYPHHLKNGSNCTLPEFSAMVGEMAETYHPDMFGIGSDLCQGQPDSVVNWMRNGHWRKHPVPAVKFPDQPTWFRDNRDFPGIAQGMSDAGLKPSLVAGVMGENWYKFFQKGLQPG